MLYANYYERAENRGEKTSLERQTDTIIYSCFFKIYPLRYQTNRKVSFAFSRPLWLPCEGHMS